MKCDEFESPSLSHCLCLCLSLSFFFFFSGTHFLALSLFFYLLYFVLFYWGKWSAFVFGKEIIDIFLTVEKVPFLGATWFLTALLQVSVIIHLAIRGFRKNKYGDFALLGMGAAVCALGFAIDFPHRISRTMVCSFFYISGYLYNKIYGLVWEKGQKLSGHSQEGFSLS